jgi:hypothetical protein
MVSSIASNLYAVIPSPTSMSPTVTSWAKTYSWHGLSEAHSVDRTSDGGYIVAGSTDESSSGSDGWLFKLGASGNVQWQKSYGTSGINGDALYKVKQISDGGFVAVGLTRLPLGNHNAKV